MSLRVTVSPDEPGCNQLYPPQFCALPQSGLFRKEEDFVIIGTIPKNGILVVIVGDAAGVH